MKKNIGILFLFLSLLTFGNPLKNMDISLLKKNLIMQGYSLKEEKPYMFFDSSQGKYKQRVVIFFHNGEPHRLEIVSSHFNLQPNKEFINDNLKKIFKIIKPSIKNKKLIIKVESVFKQLYKTDSFDLLEETNYSIRTTNLKNEESLSIEFEPKTGNFDEIFKDFNPSK